MVSVAPAVLFSAKGNTRKINGVNENVVTVETVMYYIERPGRVRSQ